MTESPMIYQYLKKYQENPSSRVFAPLAEAYRKAGLIDEAIEIAREGLEVHPSFVGGKVALARALFDQKNYEQVLEILGPVIQDVPDNIMAQRLVADSNLMLGRVALALNAYKMLLYFTPNDAETARMVQELESQAYEDGAIVLQQKASEANLSDEEKIETLRSAIREDPDERRLGWLKRVEKLESILKRVEQYRDQSANT